MGRRADKAPPLVALLLRLFPADFRARHAEQIVLFLAAERAEARYRGPLGALRFWAGTLFDLAAGALRQRLQQRVLDRTDITIAAPRAAAPRQEADSMDHLMQDLRYARRSLARRPGWTLAAAATLALGIGASSAIFSLVNGVLLAPLPFADSERLVSMRIHVPDSGRSRGVVSYPVFEAVRDAETITDGLGCYSVRSATVDFGGGAERMDAGVVSSAVFRALGVEPTVGRRVQAVDDLEHASPIAVLGHALWQERFGGDSSVVGTIIQVEGRPTEIVGVMPPSFVFPDQDINYWLSMAGQPRAETRHYLSLLGRLRAGIDADAAESRLGGIRLEVPTGSPGELRTIGIATESYLETLVGDIEPQLLLFLIAVAALLIIGCINVANLTLGRAAARGHEFSLRAALGADRLRLIRQLLTESLVLGMLGGVLGLGVAYAIDRGLLALAADQLPRGGSPGLDLRAVAFALGLSLTVGVAVGLLPALQASRTRGGGHLSAAARGVFGDRGRHRARTLMAVAQIALAATLLANAGAVLGSLNRLMAVDTGLDTAGVLAFRPMPSRDDASPASRRVFYQRLEAQLRALPGVVDVAFTATSPFGGSRIAEELLLEGQPRPASEDDEIVGDIQIVAPRFFDTVGIRALHGRLFDDRDIAQGEGIAVVNATLARRFFGEPRSAVGRRLVVGVEEYLRTLEIVGVVADVRPYRLTRATEPMVFEVFSEDNEEWASRPDLLVRVTPDQTDLVAAAIPDALRAVDTSVPIARLSSLDARIDRMLTLPRLRSRVLGVFAASALFLSMLGVYGMMSFLALERTQEIGVRLALGARRRQILLWFGRRGLLITGVGLLLGTIGARISARLLEGHLYELDTFDPRIVGLSAGLLALAALVAVLLPARRASRLDPVTALRSE